MAASDARIVPTTADALWYKSAVIYEVPVRAFFDSNADGIGDFPGLTQKLDYLQDLGVTALWLLPFYPSPLRDDGYDIADYYSINPIYGTLDDFKILLDEAHARGLRVITELVINHTSDQHPWFQRSRRAPPGSPERDFYVWSETPDRYTGTRIIFRDFEPSNWTWDPVARAYFWHRFYSHQPDLNFDNPEVHREVQRVLDYWFDLGVDGMRLDAIPYLYEREETSCENLPETHEYLKTLRAHVDEKYGDRVLIAEANQWPEDAVTYFGSGRGDECHMAFHFPLMPRMFMSVRLEDRIPITDILDQTPAIPETSQWALFLRNHDELTLEMVTDEERDYMYRVYAGETKARINLGIRRRLAPLLGSDRKRIELLNLLLFSLPGTPVLYYGDEIGMGDNIFLGDRNGVRTPMHWSADKNAGFSRASPQALYAPIILDPEYHYEAVNVETQQKNQHSLLWWTKRVLAMRKRWSVFGFGTLEFLQPENRKVLAFIRQHEDKTALVVANLSRFPQPVSLDLSKFIGHVPVELFGQTEFPVIENTAYPLTLSPHAAFWFSLEPVTQRRQATIRSDQFPQLRANDNWRDFFRGRAREEFESRLPALLRQRRWFRPRGNIKSARINEIVQLSGDTGEFVLTIVGVDYVEAESEEFVLPMGFATDEFAMRIERENPVAVLARGRIERKNIDGLLYDAASNPAFGVAICDLISRGQKIAAESGDGRLIATPKPTFTSEATNYRPEQCATRGDASNALLVFDNKFILKLFRHVESGVHPALEAAEFLAQQNFPHVPPLAGAIEFQRARGDRVCLGILSGFISNATDAWQFTLDALRRYFDRVRTLSANGNRLESISGNFVEWSEREPSMFVTEAVGSYLETARLLGQRAGELHLALAADEQNKEFAPEPFTPFNQRSLYQSLRNQITQQFRVLKRELKNLPADIQPTAEKVIASQNTILSRYQTVSRTSLSAQRIRCHGNFHLAHLLHTGKDFIISDFEGEPSRTLGERRIKRSPLRDVAGMLRSFHYTADAALRQQRESGVLGADQVAMLQPWARFWERNVGAAFLRGYRAALGDSKFLPRRSEHIAILLDAFLLDHAIIEMGRELARNSDKIRVPLEGILQLIGESSDASKGAT